MDQDFAHMVVASKVLMLKPGVMKEMPITSTEDKAQRRLEVKARSTLMMGIPNEHQLKFNSIKDAKLLLEARNKADLDTMSMDDLYNNLKVYEPEVKGISSSSLINVALSTNIDNLSDVVICAFFASQPNSPQLLHEDLQQIHPDDIEKIDLR
ncbi:hypothetical protein Tco_1110323 [Tanacetum coccineum]|uniref:Uncharacterized protein n=1 Tax=Tanacetum coccineum TaxID=301880 RepID=A0ABQ5IIJ4_9ASTR